MNNGQAVKLSESKRTYTFPGGDQVVLENVTELVVSESGNHRIKANDKLHIIPPKWIHVEIDEKDWTI